MGRNTRYLCFGLVSLAIGARCQAQAPTRSQDIPPADPTSRLRPASAVEASVIEDGLCRSATFRSLIAALETSDVIVYVSMSLLPDRRLNGGLQFIGATTTDRILRVMLRFPLERYARMAMLGHELQHAIEVAGAPEIRSQKSFEDYYRRNGMPGATESGYETDAARRTEVRVREEVAQRFTACGSHTPQR